MKRGPEQSIETDQDRPLKKRALELSATEADLYAAATAGDIEKVKQYISQGITLGEKNTIAAGVSLHFVINLDQPEAAQALIAAGANIEIHLNHKTPLYHAIENNHIAIAKMLINAKANTERLYYDLTALHFAIQKNCPEIAKALIDANADKEAICQLMTPLHYAIEKERTDIAKILIDAKVDIEAMYVDINPLQFAIENEQSQIAEYLIAAGANIEALHDGMTPLFLAVERGDVKIVEALIKSGANMDCLYEDMTVLEYAIVNQQYECAKILINAGINKSVLPSVLNVVTDYPLLNELFPYCTVAEIPLKNILNNDLSFFKSSSRKQEFLKSNDKAEYLQCNNLISRMTYHTLTVLTSSIIARQYENSFNNDDENAMSDSTVVRANWHFARKIKPTFKPALDNITEVMDESLSLLEQHITNSNNLESTKIYIGKNQHNQLFYIRKTYYEYIIQEMLDIQLENPEMFNEEFINRNKMVIKQKIRSSDPIHVIHNQIRRLILDQIYQQAVKENDQVTLQFFNQNKDNLVNGDEQTLFASCAVFTKATAPQAAWRGFNPHAPVNGEWLNLLTPPTHNEAIFSTAAAHEGPLFANTAYEILRERLAYYYLVVFDVFNHYGDSHTLQARFENFITQLADIRNAHGLDDPSCYPGTISRLGNMGAFHNIAQLPASTKQMIYDFVRTKVLAVFKDKLEQLETFAEKESLYLALSELTAEQAKGIIYHPERYNHVWLARRYEFLDLIGRPDQLIKEVKEKKLFPITKDDIYYFIHAAIDIATGQTGAALADIFERYAQRPPTEVEMKNANPFKDIQSLEHKLCQVLLSTILKLIPIYGTSIKRLHNLSWYLENKVPKLLQGTELKEIIKDLDIPEDQFTYLFNTISCALKEAGWIFSTKIINPFDQKISNIEYLIKNTPPHRAALFRQQLISVTQKQERFNHFLPAIQTIFQEHAILTECLPRVVEAFVLQVTSSDEKFNQQQFLALLDNQDAKQIQPFMHAFTALATENDASCTTSNLRMNQ